MRERKNISVEEFKQVCKNLNLEIEETTDPKIPGFLGIAAYVYSPVFKFGKDAIADLLIQDDKQEHPWVTYCDGLVKDDNYGNYIVLDEELTGLWSSPLDTDDLELHLRRAIDKIKAVEEKTKWPKRQKIEIEIYYDQERDNRFLRKDLDEIIWRLYDNLNGRILVKVLNAAGRTYVPKD